MEEIGGGIPFLATILIAGLAIAVLLVEIFRLKSSAKLTNSAKTEEGDLKYIFSTRMGYGIITFASANIRDIKASTNNCLYIPFEVSENGIKPSLNIPKALISNKMLETLQYYQDTTQKFSVFFDEIAGKRILYSAFPFSYAFDEIEDNIKDCIKEVILIAYSKEFNEIAIPLYLTDKIPLSYETYKRTIIQTIETALQTVEINVVLFSENERLEWEIIDSL